MEFLKFIGLVVCFLAIVFGIGCGVPICAREIKNKFDDLTQNKFR